MMSNTRYLMTILALSAGAYLLYTYLQNKKIIAGITTAPSSTPTMLTSGQGPAFNYSNVV